MIAKKNEELQRDKQEFARKENERVRHEVREDIVEKPSLPKRFLKSIEGFFKSYHNNEARSVYKNCILHDLQDRGYAARM